jgi:hypothetical protein
MKINRLKVAMVGELICMIFLLIYMFSTKGDVKIIVSVICIATIAILEKVTAEGIMNRDHKTFEAANVMILQMLKEQEEQRTKLNKEANDTTTKV